MGINACITSCSRQVLVFSVRDMQMCTWITIFFGQSKVNHIHLIAPLANAHQKVIRLDITMNKVLWMDILDTRKLIWPNQLIREHLGNTILPFPRMQSTSSSCFLLFSLLLKGRTWSLSLSCHCFFLSLPFDLRVKAQSSSWICGCKSWTNPPETLF